MAQGITPEDERRSDGLSHRGRTSRARPRTSTRPPVLKPFTALLLRIRHRSGTHAPSDPPRQPSLMARRSTAPPLRLRLRATAPPCLCALLLIKARRYSKGHTAEEPPHLARNIQQLCLLAHQPVQLRSEFLSTATARRGFLFAAAVRPAYFQQLCHTPRSGAAARGSARRPTAKSAARCVPCTECGGLNRHIVCCMLPVVCCMLHAACCMTAGSM